MNWNIFSHKIVSSKGNILGTKAPSLLGTFQVFFNEKSHFLKLDTVSSIFAVNFWSERR